MYCANCGHLIDNDTLFCSECGEKILPKAPKTKIKKTKKKHLFLKILIPLLLLLLLFFLFWDDVLFFFLNKQEISKEVIASSVVNVICDDGEEIWGGSGTIISTDGLILTNSHVIPQDTEALLTGDYGCLISVPNPFSGEPKELYWGDPIVYSGISDEYDLAFIQIYDVFIDEEGLTYGEFPRNFASILDEENMHDIICNISYPSLGDEIKIYGYPISSGGFNLTVTEGVISSFDENGFILTSAKIDSGNSGGLAVDERGCMLGVPVAVSEGVYENMGVIISTDLILNFVDALESFN